MIAWVEQESWLRGIIRRSIGLSGWSAVEVCFGVLVDVYLVPCATCTFLEFEGHVVYADYVDVPSTVGDGKEGKFFFFVSFVPLGFLVGEIGLGSVERILGRQRTGWEQEKGISTPGATAVIEKL